MLGNKCKLIVLAILILAGTRYSFAQQAIQSRQLPSSALHKMKSFSIHSNNNLKKYGAAKAFASAGTANGGLNTASSSGIPGIDSLVNWSDQFYYAGFDGNGNPQSIWPYTMVGTPPESRRTTNIRAPIVPVTVQLLGPDGKVALTFGPDGSIIGAALNSPEFEPNPYTNGIGQFNDQMMRAEFANRLGHKGENEGNNDDGWHTILQPKVRTARTIQVPFLTAAGTNAWYYFINAQGQPVLGAIDYDTFGNLLFPSTYPFDSSTPVGAAELAGDITTHVCRPSCSITLSCS